ncbi:hypothetical protein [Virgibacillus pantothenticus]
MARDTVTYQIIEGDRLEIRHFGEKVWLESGEKVRI